MKSLITGAWLLLATLLIGCAGSFEEARLVGVNRRAALENSQVNRDYCRKLDAARTRANAVAGGFAALSLPSGLATVPVQSDEGKIILAIISVASGTGAVIARLLSEDYGKTWVLEGCAQS